MYTMKPRQIINFGAGVALIDPHQLNVKTTSDNTNQQHWTRDNIMSSKNKTSRTTTRNIRFPNRMIEQIHIALEEQGSWNFSAWVIEACRRRLSTEKRIKTAQRNTEELNTRSGYFYHRTNGQWREINPHTLYTVKSDVHRFDYFRTNEHEVNYISQLFLLIRKHSVDTAYPGTYFRHWVRIYSCAPSSCFCITITRSLRVK